MLIHRRFDAQVSRFKFPVRPFGFLVGQIVERIMADQVPENAMRRAAAVALAILRERFSQAPDRFGFCTWWRDVGGFVLIDVIAVDQIRAHGQALGEPAKDRLFPHLQEERARPWSVVLGLGEVSRNLHFIGEHEFSIRAAVFGLGDRVGRNGFAPRAFNQRDVVDLFIIAEAVLELIILKNNLRGDRLEFAGVTDFFKRPATIGM